MTDRMEHTYMDRSNLEKGEWDNEPDFVCWTDSFTQYKCLIRRSCVATLLGYVGVEKGHPCYGMDYLSVPVDAYGGVNFSDHIGYQYPSEDKSISQNKYPFNWAVDWGKENSETWWIGFDCSHYCDLVPLKGRPLMSEIVTYKNIAFVTKEVESLARQLKDIEGTRK